MLKIKKRNVKLVDFKTIRAAKKNGESVKITNKWFGGITYTHVEEGGRWKRPPIRSYLLPFACAFAFAAQVFIVPQFLLSFGLWLWLWLWFDLICNCVFCFAIWSSFTTDGEGDGILRCAGRKPHRHRGRD